MPAMKCQHCPKLSTLQITEIHGENNFEEFHLCDECAQKYLYETSPKKKKKNDWLWGLLAIGLGLGIGLSTSGGSGGGSSGSDGPPPPP